MLPPARDVSTCKRKLSFRLYRVVFKVLSHSDNYVEFNVLEQPVASIFIVEKDFD
jgi:hypothetical protein